MDKLPEAVFDRIIYCLGRSDILRLSEVCSTNRFLVDRIVRIGLVRLTASIADSIRLRAILDSFKIDALSSETLDQLRQFAKVDFLRIDKSVDLPLETLLTLPDLTTLMLRHFNQSIDHLRSMTSLEYLSMMGFNGSLEPLIDHPNLRKLSLDGKFTGSIEPILGLDLEMLSLANVRSVDQLIGFTSITTLNIELSGEVDLGPIGFLTTLTDLWLDGATTIDPLRHLTRLDTLTVDGPFNESLEPLSHLIALNRLWVSSDTLNQSIEPLKRLTRLGCLWIRMESLESFETVHDLTNLNDLWITTDYPLDIEPLASLTKLKTLALDVDFDASQIDFLVDLTLLTDLDLGEKWDGPLDQIASMVQVKRLSLGIEFDHPLDPIVGWTNLETLVIQGDISHPIPPLPTSVKKVLLNDEKYDLLSEVDRARFFPS